MYSQHIHVCTIYTYTVYIFATFNLCTDKNPVKSHYTVLPEGEVPINLINSQNSQKELQKTMIIFKNYLRNNTQVPNKTNQLDEKIIMTP